jgi:hypothetical protein
MLGGVVVAVVAMSLAITMGMLAVVLVVALAVRVATLGARAPATGSARTGQAVVLGGRVAAAMGVSSEKIVEADMKVGYQLEPEDPEQARGQR